MKVILYYHFAKVANPQELVDKTRAFCQEKQLLGRILISEQGINGTLGGSDLAIDAYKKWFSEQPGFEKVWFKEQQVDHNPFPKLAVRKRKELVTLRRNVDPKDGGKHISPAQVNELAKQDNVVFFDARNEIESRVGKFHNAICPDIKTFRELPKALEKYKEELKGKKVIMYCTGGIRCETASVLMKELPVDDVYQIDGGIYNYCTQYPDGLFEGACYVFDDRMQIGFGKQAATLDEEKLSKDKLISECEFCGDKCARVVNDERYLQRVQRVCCKECDKKNDISRLRTKEERKAMMS